MSVGNSVEKLEPSYSVRENVNFTVVESNLAILPNVKDRITI